MKIIELILDEESIDAGAARARRTRCRSRTARSCARPRLR